MLKRRARKLRKTRVWEFWGRGRKCLFIVNLSTTINANLTKLYPFIIIILCVCSMLYKRRCFIFAPLADLLVTKADQWKFFCRLLAYLLSHLQHQIIYYHLFSIDASYCCAMVEKSRPHLACISGERDSLLSHQFTQLNGSLIWNKSWIFIHISRSLVRIRSSVAPNILHFSAINLMSETSWECEWKSNLLIHSIKLQFCRYFEL